MLIIKKNFEINLKSHILFWEKGIEVTILNSFKFFISHKKQKRKLITFLCSTFEKDNKNRINLFIYTPFIGISYSHHNLNFMEGNYLEIKILKFHKKWAWDERAL